MKGVTYLLSNEQFEKDLNRLLSRKFPSDVAAQIELTGFRDIARAAGFRGRVTRYQVVDGTITDDPRAIAHKKAMDYLAKLAAKPKTRQERVRAPASSQEATQKEEIKAPLQPLAQVPTSNPEQKNGEKIPAQDKKEAQEQPVVQATTKVPKAPKSEPAAASNERRGGRKPRALKREAKKLKDTKGPKKAKPKRLKKH